MGKPEKYEPAHRQLRRLLADARDEGLGFVAAWERAVRPTQKPVITTDMDQDDRPYGAVAWPAYTPDRQLIRTAVLEGKDSWQRCYNLDPVTPAERALLVLFSELREDGEGEYDPRAQPTEHAGRPSAVSTRHTEATRVGLPQATVPKAHAARTAEAEDDVLAAVYEA